MLSVGWRRWRYRRKSISNASREGRYISVDNNTLVILRPSGRDKAHRIEAALAWPLFNSKIFISSAVPYARKSDSSWRWINSHWR